MIMTGDIQSTKPKHLAVLAVLLAALLATLLLAACVAPVVMLATAPMTAPGPEPMAPELAQVERASRIPC